MKIEKTSDKISIVRCEACIFYDARKRICTNVFGLFGTAEKYDYCSRGKTREQVQEHQE